LANAVILGRKIKATWIGKKEIPSSFIGDFVVYVENSKELTTKLELISNYSKVTRQKVK
jgi:hypothetical protein